MRRIALLLSVLATMGSLIACSGGEDLTGLEAGGTGQPALLDSGTDPSSNN